MVMCLTSFLLPVQECAELGEFEAFNPDATGSVYERIKARLNQFRRQQGKAGGSGVAAADKPVWCEYNSDESDDEEPMTRLRSGAGKVCGTVVLDDDDSD